MSGWLRWMFYVFLLVYFQLYVQFNAQYFHCICIRIHMCVYKCLYPEYRLYPLSLYLDRYICMHILRYRQHVGWQSAWAWRSSVLNQGISRLHGMIHDFSFAQAVSNGCQRMLSDWSAVLSCFCINPSTLVFGSSIFVCKGPWFSDSFIHFQKEGRGTIWNPKISSQFLFTGTPCFLVISWCHDIVGCTWSLRGDIPHSLSPCWCMTAGIDI